MKGLKASTVVTYKAKKGSPCLHPLGLRGKKSVRGWHSIERKTWLLRCTIVPILSISNPCTSFLHWKKEIPTHIIYIFSRSSLQRMSPSLLWNLEPSTSFTIQTASKICPLSIKTFGDIVLITHHFLKFIGQQLVEAALKSSKNFLWNENQKCSV